MVNRSDMEFSSSQIGHASTGAVLAIVEKCFSGRPSDHCIELTETETDE